MVTEAARYSVIIPVCNEATTLPQTVPAVMAELAGDQAEVIYVCNGCNDGSAALVRARTAGRAAVIELAQASKTAALNAGDAASAVFPRFYLDADVVVPVDGFRTLIAAMEDGQYDLVSPQFAFDLSGASRAARAISQTWLALPHVTENGFHGLLCISERGRSRWDLFPDILADDAFIAAMIPSEQRRILAQVTCHTRPPARFWAWVLVRARWLRGDRQLRKLGVVLPQNHGQARALAARLLSPNTCAPTLVFLCARLLAVPLSFGKRVWYADRPLAGKPDGASLFGIGHQKPD